jgi:PTH1 family peptidyl-tRNA hydrolase
MKPSLIVVGLGNPGKAYEKTRHNAGFLALDVLSKEIGQGEWTDKQKFSSLVQEARILTVPVLLVKPLTFMNRSGEAVQKIVDFYKILPAHQLIVLSDDIDLPVGDTRLRMSGGPGTHNGLKSVCLALGEQYPRIRIGLGTKPSNFDLANWVLSVPSDDEGKKLQEAYERIPEMIREYVLNTSKSTED